MAESSPKRPCPTCQRPWSPDAFYERIAECKACKRDRSRRNRLLQARKLAAFERFVDVLITLADGAAAPEPDHAEAVSA